MAKRYLILLILTIFALGFLVKAEKGVYPLVLSLSLLPLGVLAYSARLSLIVTAVIICILLFFAYIFFMGIGFSSTMPALFAFGITPAAFGILRNAFYKLELSTSSDIDTAQKEAQALQEKVLRLNDELRELDKKVSEIANLYEITKEMSSTLLFGEISRLLSEFLKKNFTFTECRLILSFQHQKDPDKKKIEKVYKIETGSPSAVKPELVDVDIFGEIHKTKKIIFREDFIAIPLVITQGKIIGALSVKGLDEAFLEKFLIVSRQFSLAIEKVQLYETVQELAITDGLTGAFVRRYFLEMLKEEFERSVRHKFKMSFLMIDLDWFKKYNDTFGHLVGDVMLREVAMVLRENIREIDLLGRYGGEEFSILLPETDKAGAALVAERLREAIANRAFKAYNEVLKMTISIGVAAFPDDALLSSDLIEFADQALYEAKNQGRNRVALKKGVI